MAALFDWLGKGLSWFFVYRECPSCRLFCHVENLPKSAKPISGKSPENPAEVRKSEISIMKTRDINNYRNGQSISERHWDDQWIQDIQSSRYLGNGYLEQMSISVSPDCGTVTNHVSLMDFLGRSVCIVTPLGTTSNLYDGASSRLVSTTRFTPSTSSTSTYLYDDMRAQVGRSQNGITSLSDTVYEFVSNEWWRVTSQSTFCNGVTNSFSVSREQLTGLSNALRRRSCSTSPDDVTTHSFASFNSSTERLNG